MKKFFLFLALSATVTACTIPMNERPTAHACSMEDCNMIGDTYFISESPEGSDGYLFDLTHYNHPAWSYEDCENFVFGYGEEINNSFDIPNTPPCQ